MASSCSCTSLACRLYPVIAALIVLVHASSLAAEPKGEDFWLLTLDGHRLSYEDLTGVPFAVARQASADLEKFVSSADSEAIAHGASVTPVEPFSRHGGGGYLEEVLQHACQEFINITVANAVFDEFLKGSGVSASEVFDLQAVQRNTLLQAKYGHACGKALSAVWFDGQDAKTVYLSSPLVQQTHDASRWEASVKLFLRAAPRGVSRFKMVAFPDYLEERQEPAAWYVARERLKVFHEVLLDYVTMRREEFSRKHEESVGKIEFIESAVGRDSDVADAEAIIRAVVDAEGHVSLAKLGVLSFVLQWWGSATTLRAGSSSRQALAREYDLDEAVLTPAHSIKAGRTPTGLQRYIYICSPRAEPRFKPSFGDSPQTNLFLRDYAFADVLGMYLSRVTPRLEVRDGYRVPTCPEARLLVSCAPPEQIGSLQLEPARRRRN